MQHKCLMHALGCSKSTKLHYKSECVEDEHHFLFDCPAYAHIRYNHATLFHGIQTVSAVVNNDNPCLLGRYLRQCFEHRQSVLG